MKKLLTLMVAAFFGCPLFGALTDGLVAHYKFDGNANDSSGNGNNGVVHGATLTTDRFGNANSAYGFDGVDDSIRVSSSVSLETATTVFGVSVWMKSDWGDYNVMPIINKDWQLSCVLQKANTGVPGQPDENDFFVGAGRLEDDFEFGCNVPVDGCWHHWAFVGDGVNIKVYLDGSYKGSGSVGEVDKTDNDLYFGVGNGVCYLSGSLDDLRIYNRALSAAEVRALYEGDGLVAHYKFDGNANDSSGNGNNGVVHGATLTTDRFGNADCAYLFDGNDWIQVANSASLSSPVKDMTFSAWVNVREPGLFGWAPILGKGNDKRQYGFGLGLVDKHLVCVNDVNGTGSGKEIYVSVDSDALPMNEWYHLTASYDGSRIVAYVNGVAVGFTDVVDEFAANMDDLCIGRDVPDVEEYFNGALDDLRIYNRALSAAEVKSLYEGDGVSKTWYVNGTSGSDSYSGTSSSQAKKTIQAAIDAAADGDVICVASGVYAPIVSAQKLIAIKGAGAGNTIIDGGGQTYCADLKYGYVGDIDMSFTNTVLIGFTLQNGNGGGVTGGTVRECVVKGCRNGSGCGHCVVENSLIIDNSGINGGGAIGGVVKNCIVVGNSASNNGGGVYSSAIINSIVWNNTSDWDWGDDGGNIYNEASAPDELWKQMELPENIGVCVVDPKFVDAANGDYRLAANSPCIDAGDNSYVTSETDLGGNSRIVNGKVDIGCYEYGADAIGKFCVTQYSFKDSPWSIDEALSKIDNPSSWCAQPISGAYPVIAFSDSWGNEDFQYSEFPGNSGGTAPAGFAVICKGKLYVRESGTYTFCCGSDDGFRCVISTDENRYTFEYAGERNYGRTFKTISFSKAGVCDLDLTHFSYGRGILFLSVAKGTHSSFDSSAFKLVGDPASGITLVGAGVPTTCAVTFNANGGTCSTSTKQYMDGSAVGTLPSATRAGYAFLGWFTAAVGGTQVTATTVVTEDVTFYAHWTPVGYSISYAGVKGGVNLNPTSYTIEDAITFSALGDVTGYRFTGWSPRSIARGTTGNKTVAAQYAPIVYSISYVNTMGAANPNPASYTIESAVTFAALPDVEGWRFVGWSFAGISRGNTGDVTVSANWEATTPSVILDDEEPMDAGVANTYDGIIMDADGLPVGYISIKAAKASGKGEIRTSKVKATIQMVGEAKKVTVKGNVTVSEATLVQSAPDGRVLDLMFTRNSIFGTFDGYEIEGVRNILASTAKGDKGSEAKQRAEAIYNRLKGNYVMAYGDEAGWNGLSLSIMAKGKVKVSGALADGTKVSTSTQMIVGEDYSCIPVIYTKKDVSLSFSIYFSNEGEESFVFGYYDAVISRVAALGGERLFCLYGNLYDLFDDAGCELLEDFLPWEVAVVPKGTKWIIADGAMAGQIKMDKDGEVYDAKESENPSGLKLTFTPKTGLFKGSFKAYAIDAKGKLKRFSASVNGIVVNGIGYGTATIKKMGSVSVMIE